jgi:citrate lyase subunit beta/citryl-CoA lyase
MRHPSQVLFTGEKSFPCLPAVDHYAGSEKLIGKALKLQHDLGPLFDITCDCEDGAHAGANREHAEMVARKTRQPSRESILYHPHHLLHVHDREQD